MKLSIVTINFNDAVGLRRTLDSVAAQQLAISPSSPSSHLATSPVELEHIIIDGGSTDGSVEVIRNYESKATSPSSHLATLPITVRWISEKDKGVYNAMNKGIKMATGDYIQILNSGDILASNDVIARMWEAIKAMKGNDRRLVGNDRRLMGEEELPEIIYGNMLKAMQDGKIVRDNCGGAGACGSFLYFYKGTLNHDCAWIKRNLFDKFGLYDEEMKICSDWKWYVNAIALGGVKPIYVNIDVTVFDMNGISESGGKNKALIQKERRAYLEQILPASILLDYDQYAFPIYQYRRLKKHHLWCMIYFVERVLFKLEKWGVIHK